MAKFAILVLALVLIIPAFSQTTQPFVADSTTRALWHFDEGSGTTIFDSAGGNDGSAVGATSVPGRFGLARQLDGVDDYIIFPSSTAFDFGYSSFKIDIWFKTTDADGFLIRRGEAPDPGFHISIFEGHVNAQFGNRGDSAWPDTLILLVSDSTFHDGSWHLATLHRDRVARKFFLYVDDSLATRPVDDPVTFAISSTRPLTIGRWEYYAYPHFLAAVIDEVRISCAELLPSAIDVRPRALSFGDVAIGMSDTLFLKIGNSGGGSGNLIVSSITSSNPQFSVAASLPPIPRGRSDSVAVIYTPTLVGRDSGSISIESNDANNPLFVVPVSGRAIRITEQPQISGVYSYSYSQARLVWWKSALDTEGSPDPVASYSVWKRITPPSGSPSAPGEQQGSLSVLDQIWEFVVQIPAMTFDRYATLVPRNSDFPYAVFLIGAHTAGNRILLSEPDSITRYPVTGIDPGPGESIPDAIGLSQNYPNPFNPHTTIRFELPAAAQVRLSVFDLLGREVSVLTNGRRDAGVHEVRFDASGFPSGIYFYRLRAGETVRARKLLLLK